MHEVSRMDITIFYSAALSFVVSVAISMGAVIGHVSVLYHQSIDDMIEMVIKQLRLQLDTGTAKSI
jgi:hypothetical protein